MRTFFACLTVLGILNKYQVSGIPVHARLAVEPPVGGTGTVGGTGVSVILPVGTALEKKKEPGLVVGGALTSEERQTGIAIASKLKNVLKDESRPVMLPGRREPIYPYNHDIDCQFVLDSSGSIGYREFIKAKKATKLVVDFIHNKSAIPGSRIGLIEYSTPAKTHVEFIFGTHNSVWAVKNAIDSVSYDNGGSTATALALRMAKTQIQQNGKWNNAKLVWLVSDGRSNTGGSPFTPATELKNMGVTVCGIGVGNSVDMTEINAIASPHCAWKVTSFSSYERVMEFAFGQRGGSEHSPSIEPGFFNGLQL